MERDTVQFVVLLLGLGLEAGIFYGAVQSLKEKTRRLESSIKNLGERLEELSNTQTRHDERLQQLRERASLASTAREIPRRRLTRSGIPATTVDDGGSHGDADDE